MSDDEAPGGTATLAGPGSPKPTGDATFAKGAVLDERYSVVRFIARGGMGEVYEVEDTALDQRIALKTLLPAIASNPTSMARFRREIQLARRITHANICRVFDVGFHREGAAEIAFLTMELLPGESLAAWIKRRAPVSLAEARPILRQLIAGLDAAHAAHIVHRDFKSQNVMLVGERAVITDFGLARNAASESAAASLTGTGGIIGSPAYMAPEQVLGEPTTPATDVYALGVVMFELATGRLPFQGETPMAIASKRLTDDPPAPSSLVRDLDPAWDAVILRCLQREPAARYPRASALVGDLDIRPSTVSMKFVRRRRWPIAIGLVAALATTGIVWVARDGEPEEVVEDAPRDRAVGLLLDNDLDGARNAFITAIGRDFGDKIAFRYLATTLRYLDEREGYVKAARMAGELGGNFSDSDRKWIAAEFERATGSCAAAARTLAELAPARERDLVFLLDLAETQDCAGDAAGARVTLATARRHFDGEPALENGEALIAMRQGRHGDAIAAAERGFPIARERNKWFLIGGLLETAAVSHLRRSELQQAITRARESNISFSSETRSLDAMTNLTTLGAAYLQAGQLARARSSFDEATEVARHRGRGGLGLRDSALVAGYLGDFAAAAKALAGSAASSAGDSPTSTAVISDHLVRALVMIRAGQITTATAELDRIDATELDPKTPLAAAIDLARGAVEAELELPTAKASLERGIATFDQLGTGNLAARGRLDLGLLLETRPRDARPVVDAARTELESERLPVVYIAYAHAIAARIALAEGNLEQARRDRAAALERDTSGDPYAQLWIRIVGEQVKGRGNARESASAKAALDKVIAEATRLGFAGLALEGRLVQTQIEPIDRAALDGIAKDATVLGQLRIARLARK